MEDHPVIFIVVHIIRLIMILFLLLYSYGMFDKKLIKEKL